MTTPPDGYLATPAAGNGRAVLVLHPWWGLNDTIRGVCDRLADAGYLVFAPDLYHGHVADTIAGAEALMERVDGGRALEETIAAARYLHERGGRPADGLAVIGFSMGAYYAVMLSEAAPELAGRVVIFYGTAPAELTRSRAAFLAHFAGDDPFEPREYVDGMESGLRAAGRPVTFHHYPGAGHWFVEPDRPEYDPAAAALAWERTLAFLDGAA